MFVNQIFTVMEVMSSTDSHMFKTLFSFVLGSLIFVLGIIFNIINLVVFIKQGLGHTANTSMIAIAVADICSLITFQWNNINISSFLENVQLPYQPITMSYLTGGWPHACFLQTIIWITLYVMVERFACIFLPLKVKAMFTPLRTKVIIILIYILTLLTLVPVNINVTIGGELCLWTNESQDGPISFDSVHNIEDIVFIVAVIRLISFCILSLFTCLLVLVLKRRLNWRKQSFSDDKKLNMISRRGKKTIKILFVTSAVLIIGTAPGIMLPFVRNNEPILLNFIRLCSTYHLTWGVVFHVEAIASSLNILFFYKMSSNYRRTLHELVSRCRARFPSYET
jgi:hypothetical protein